MFVYIKKYLHFAIIGALFMVAEVAMDLFQPGFMRRIVDEGVLKITETGIDGLSLIVKLGLSMIGIALIGGICGSLNNIFVNYSSQNICNLIRKDCFVKVLSFSFPQVDKIGTGALITRITNDVNQIETFIAMFARGMVRTLFLAVGSLYCLFRLKADFGYVALCAIPFIIGCMIYCMFKVEPLSRSLQEKLEKINNILEEDIVGIRIVKACIREIYEKIRFGKANDELIADQLKILIFFSLFHPFANILMYFAVAYIILNGGQAAVKGIASPGSIMAAITYSTQLLHAVLMVAMIFQSITKGKVSWERIQQILSIEPEIANGSIEKESFQTKNEAALTMDNLPEKTENHLPVPFSQYIHSNAGTIEFKNVSFSYSSDDCLILKDINLKINSGETVAIMGATGCGKTTLVNLIPRFYEVTSGQVLVDGVDVKEFALEDLRNKISFVLQKAELFQDTIAGNIKWGKPSASEKEIRKATDIAQASEFIDKTDKGFDTVVAQRGMSLSGGQRQRISIARAVLNPAENIIFDDSTSALDLKTESDFYSALEKNYPNITKIIVAQRIASVKRANRIVVLENGSIAACGSHDELLRNCETYKDIYLSQVGEETRNDR